jgi:hypothetical protein
MVKEISCLRIYLLSLYLSVKRSHHVRREGLEIPTCRMDLLGPTTSVDTRTDYSVAPWDYPTCAARHLLA